MRTSVFVALFASVCFAASAGAQQATKESVPGVTNFARVETTVACGGVIKTSAVAELKQLGFKSIFDLQLPEEQGADIAGEAAAAKAVGMNFVHVPFTPANPDTASNTASIDKFLKEVVLPANEPAFIHCAGGSRAAGFWFIKRVLSDHWDTDRAMKEAEGLGLTNGGVKTFATNYVQAHKK